MAVQRVVDVSHWKIRAIRFHNDHTCSLDIVLEDHKQSTFLIHQGLYFGEV